MGCELFYQQSPLAISMGFWIMVGVFVLGLNFVLSMWGRSIQAFLVNICLLIVAITLHRLTLDLCMDLDIEVSHIFMVGFASKLCLLLALVITLYTLLNNRR